MMKPLITNSKESKAKVYTTL